MLTTVQNGDLSLQDFYLAVNCGGGFPRHVEKNDDGNRVEISFHNMCQRGQTNNLYFKLLVTSTKLVGHAESNYTTEGRRKQVIRATVLQARTVGAPVNRKNITQVCCKELYRPGAGSSFTFHTILHFHCQQFSITFVTLSRTPPLPDTAPFYYIYK
jgi:hypothetical protein